MASCAFCGGPVNPGASFCSACGANVAAAGARATGSAVPFPAARPPTRPVGITLIAAATLIFGIGWLLLFVFVAAFFGAAAGFVGILFGDGAAFLAPVLGGFALLALLFVLAMTGLTVAVAVGLLRGREWARILLIVFLGLAGVSGLLGLAGGDPSGLFPAAVAGLVIWYVFRPEVTAWFRRA